MSRSRRLLLAYFGDDFTGSTDALEWLSRAGLRTVLFLQPPTPVQLERFPNLQAVGVAGRTRALERDTLAEELRPALRALRALDPQHVHYKVCSTFDSSPTIGSIGRAIDVASEVFEQAFIPLVVGAPALGRYCVFGNLFARFGIGSEGEIHRLDRHPAMSRHPVTPADESDLRLHLQRQTAKRVALCDVLQYARSEDALSQHVHSLVAGGAEVVLFDVLADQHLEQIGSLLDGWAAPGRPLFSVGSSAIEVALASHWRTRNERMPIPTWNDPSPVDCLLVVSGSCSPVTEGQLAWARTNGFAEVFLDSKALPLDPTASPDRRSEIGSHPALATAEVINHLKAGRSAIVHTLRRCRNPEWEAAAPSIGCALGKIVRAAVVESGVTRVVVAGGDTSSYVARELRIEALEMIAPLAPGAPLCRVHAAGEAVDGIEINVKGGQVGAEDYFGAVARGKL